MNSDRSTAEETRFRLLDALAWSIDERGYGATSVDDIVRRARASKRTYYQHFANKQECYLALQARAIDDLITQIRTTVDPDAHWHEQIRQMLTAYGETIRSRPALALSFVRDLAAMGAPGRAVQRRNFDAMVDFVTGLATNPRFQRDDVRPLTPQVATILLGGIRELAAQAVEDGIGISAIIDPAAATAITLMTAPSPRS